jgi:hypothetical protein
MSTVSLDVGQQGWPVGSAAYGDIGEMDRLRGLLDSGAAAGGLTVSERTDLFNTLAQSLDGKQLAHVTRLAARPEDAAGLSDAIARFASSDVKADYARAMASGSDTHRGNERIRLADASGWSPNAPTALRPAPLAPAPPAGSPWLRVPFGPGAALLGGAVVLSQIRPGLERSATEGALKRFGLDPTSGTDVLAARAYVFGKNFAPVKLLPDVDVPWGGAANERVAQALMRNEQQHPGMLGRADAGDPSAQSEIRKVAARALVAPPPDSGVETRTPEERDLVARLKAEGKGNQDIQNALAELRQAGGAPPLTGVSSSSPPLVPGNDDETALVAALREAGGGPPQINTELRELRAESGASDGSPRNQPGVAHTSAPLTTIEGTWLRGTQQNAGKFPAQVAQKLEGRQFENFNEFRQAFWKAVADTPALSAQFSPRNQALMQRGYAPIAAKDQWHGGQARYVLHHATPIAREGGVYDMSNIVVLTPRMHQDVLARGYHFGNDR